MQPSIAFITLSPDVCAQPIADFAAARNALLKQATSDWVVFLDTDEKISQEDKLKLSQILTKTTADGLYLLRRDIFYGKKLQHAEWGTARILRAMRPTKAKYVGKVHEVATILGTSEHTDIEILHHSHESIAQFVEKVSHYAQLAAAERKTTLQQDGLEICTFPIAKFFVNYFFLGGCLDGWRGLVYATLMSMHSFLVRAYSIAGRLER